MGHGANRNTNWHFRLSVEIAMREKLFLSADSFSSALLVRLKVDWDWDQGQDCRDYFQKF